MAKLSSTHIYGDLLVDSAITENGQLLSSKYAASSHGTHLTLGTGSGNAFRGDYGNTAYNHSQAAHAPSNAQKNSDITKAEIEAKLTGAITSHTHNYAPSSHTHTVLSVKSDNWKDSAALPSTYDRGETLFFSYNPTSNKFNNLTYGMVQTLKEYGSGSAAWQFLYPYNASDDKFYVRNAQYNTDSWRSWAEVYTSLNKPTPSGIGAAPTSHASTATTYGVSSASNYGHAMASGTTPKANGTAAVGSETAKFARGDHVHPLQTTVSGNAGTATKFASAQSVALTGDVTGSASSQAGWSVATTLKNSGVTAGSYGPSANASPAHSGTFSVPYLTVDAKGRVTAASTKTITLPASGNTDTKVTYTLGTTTKYYMGGPTATATGTGGITFDTGIYATTTAGQLSVGSLQTRGAITTSGNGSHAIGSTANRFSGIYGANIYAYDANAQHYASLRTTTVGTADTQGVGRLIAGNNVNAGTAGNAKGQVLLYGTNTGYTTITPGYNSTSNITIELPSAGGKLMMCVADANNYWGMLPPTGTTSCWMRSPESGLLPYDNTINSSLGGSAYVWKSAFVKTLNIYGSSGQTYGNFNVATIGTTSTVGESRITIGNGIAEGTDKNSYGRIAIYGKGKGYSWITPGNNSDSNITLTLPSSGGTLARTADLNNYLPLSGGTLTGNVTLQHGTANKESFYVAKRTDTGVGVFMGVGSGGTNHGVYSQKLDKWMVYADGSKIYLQGNADTATTATTATKLKTARTLTIGATGKTFDGSGNVSWSLQDIMKGQGLNASTACSTLYFNNAGTSHVGRVSVYNDSNGDYVQLGLYNTSSSSTVSTLNIYANHARFNKYLVLYDYIRPNSNGSIDMGASNYRWRTVYSANGVSTTSDRTLKENIKYVRTGETEINYNDMYNFVKNDLELATYNYINSEERHINFIAQDLLANEDGTDNKVGQFIINPVPVPAKEDIENGEPYPLLSYNTNIYTSVLAGALKESIDKIEELESEKAKMQAEINELKADLTELKAIVKGLL